MNKFCILQGSDWLCKAYRKKWNNLYLRSSKALSHYDASDVALNQ